MKGVPLQKVFNEINRQTDLQFFYNDKLLKQAGKVDITVNNMPVQDALNLCFKNLPISYQLVNNSVFIREKTNVPSGIEETPLINITGTVTNEKDEPVAGASIFIKGTHKGTTTNTAGYFSLTDVDSTAVLVISGTNIETIKIKAGRRNILNIQVRLKVSAVDEVQVIAYGSSTKRLNTGSVASIKGNEINDRPVGNIMQALQGKLPGMSVVNSGPGLGAASTVMIRGVNSITSGINPLIVVDGVIVNDQTNNLIFSSPTNGGYQGSNTYNNGVSTLNFVNPSDIESVSVLKDADATSIYGSRGTNGVILITTKKAALGKLSTTVNISTGWKSPTIITPRMNTAQYLQMRKDAFAMGNADASSAINPIIPDQYNAPDLTTWSQTAYTNFPKMDIGNAAPNYNVNASMTGGNKALNFVASGDYYKMYDDYMFKPYQERTIGRLQINHTSLNNKLNLTLGATIGSENQRFTMTNLINSTDPTAINPPNFPLYNPDGSLNPGLGYSFSSGFQGYNPYFNQTISAKSATSNVLLNGQISYVIMEGLVAKLPVSYNSQNNAYNLLFPSTAVSTQDPSVPFGQHTTTSFNSVNWEPQLSYNKTYSKLTLGALAGLTFLDKKMGGTFVQVNNPGSDDLLNSWASGNPTTTESNSSEEKFQSVFARVNLDWKKTYILNVNYRRDGSSRFGPDNRYANFASAGVGWLFSNESFVKNNVSFLSFGKLRGSYGTTGNNNIPNYQYLSLLRTPDVWFSGAYPGYIYSSPLQVANYANPGVRWETTAKTDIGLELGFLNNRIMLGATWYQSVTSDLLVTVPLAGQSGFDSYVGNIDGRVQNSGWEFELNTQNLAPGNPVQWNTKFNFSTNTNLLKSFPGLASSGLSATYQVGRALPSPSYLAQQTEMSFHFVSIDPSNGLPIFQDANGDGHVNDKDYMTNSAWWGTSLPTIWGGLTNSVSYKGFTFDIFFTFSNGIFSKWNYWVQNPVGSIYNPAADVSGNYWMKPGDESNYPRLYTNEPGNPDYINPIKINYPRSTAALYKGYYIRLKNVQLTYSLPLKLASKLKMNNVAVYVNGDNLAVYTPVKLYKDPETLSLGNTNSLLRTITIGIRFQF
jgi:TonB-dependent starch-binding outer membrane protein SusC